MCREQLRCRFGEGARPGFGDPNKRALRGRPCSCRGRRSHTACTAPPTVGGRPSAACPRTGSAAPAYDLPHQAGSLRPEAALARYAQPTLQPPGGPVPPCARATDGVYLGGARPALSAFRVVLVDGSTFRWLFILKHLCAECLLPFYSVHVVEDWGQGVRRAGPGVRLVHLALARGACGGRVSG